MQFFFKKNWLLLLVIAFASIISFTNLGGQDYALDEGLTVAVAGSVPVFGYPSAWDGKILISSAVNGSDSTLINGRYFWTWQPWLQYYLIAPFYIFFGPSVGMLRIPFALFGVGSIAIFYLIALDIFKKKWLAALLSIQLIFLLPFFLYMRQIRYYAPSTFFSVLLFWLLLRFVKKKPNKRWIGVFFLISLLLFWTNYLIWISCLPLFFLFSIWKRNKAVLLILTIEAILAFLWFHFFTPFGGNPTTAYGHRMLLQTMYTYLTYSNNFILPFVLIPFILLAAWKLKKLYYLWLSIIWIGIKIVMYSLVLDPHGRYLADAMPIFVLLLGFLYEYLGRYRQILFIILIVSLTTITNVFSLVPTYVFPAHQRQFRLYPQEFVSELTGYYPTVVPAISEYIAKRAEPGDTVWTNNYNWPLYLYSHVPLVSTICNTKTNKFAGPQSITQENKVRWFVFFQQDMRQPQELTKLPCLGAKWQIYMQKNYIKKVLHVNANTYITNDPDIVNRQFPPEKLSSDTVVLYEKKK